MTEAQRYWSDSVDVASAVLGLSRRATVWIPSGARASSRSPVLYLNDGQNLFDSARAYAGVTWRVAETAAWLIERSLIPPLVIVGIDHGELRRAREYLPVEDERNPFARDPLATEYGSFVTKELMPFIEREYPVARGASNTAFGGSSYGAVAALFTAMTNPGVFGRLLLESPSLYVGRGALLKGARRTRRWPQRVYLGVGTAETRRDDWNAETVANVRRLEAILRGSGLGARRLRVTVEEGASHSEAAWAGRFAQALEFLFGTTGARNRSR
jgi:enterochelin esterase-like enzyme